MEQLDTEKFGIFVAKLRKEREWTQKDLAQRLFVSDKAVSKWERGLSIPNAALLMPMAEVLGVTVTELLRGERLETEQQLHSREVEKLVTGSLDLSLKENLKQRRKKWIGGFILCVIIAVAEISALYGMGMTTAQMKENVLLMTGLMLGFGGWSCIFAKEILPVYYDENRLDYYTQGFFRMHLPGLRFNNSNWGHVCTVMKVWTLASAVLYPGVCLCVVPIFGIAVWHRICNPVMLVFLVGMVLSIYGVGKRYE